MFNLVLQKSETDDSESCVKKTMCCVLNRKREKWRKYVDLLSK